MKDKLIDYDTAILAKNKNCELIKNITWLPSKSWNKTNITQSLLAKWLRETHDIHNTVSFDDCLYKYYFQVYSKGNVIYSKDDDSSLTYEIAFEKALLISLTLIK